MALGWAPQRFAICFHCHLFRDDSKQRSRSAELNRSFITKLSMIGWPQTPLHELCQFPSGRGESPRPESRNIRDLDGFVNWLIRSISQILTSRFPLTFPRSSRKKHRLGKREAERYRRPIQLAIAFGHFLVNFLSALSLDNHSSNRFALPREISRSSFR